MVGKQMFSKVSRSLLLVFAVAAGLVGSQQAFASHLLAARGGSSAFFADAGCWSPNGPSMTNVCSSARWWYVPLMDTGSTWVYVTAQGASNASNVTCGATGWDKNGNWYYGSGWWNLTQFGPPVDIVMPLYVPGGGTADVNCNVNPGGKVITVNW